MSESTSAETLKIIKLTEVEKVTADFLDEINKKGIVRTFEWMSCWFDSVARAQIVDELEKLEGHIDQKQARGLYLSAVVNQMANGISNQSTMESSNIMRRSRLSAAAFVLDRNNGYGSNSDRSKAWDVLIDKENKNKADAEKQK